MDREALFRRGWDLLAQGDYRQGFALWEANRFDRGLHPIRRPVLSFREWQGEPVSSLLVIPEQGYGDQIQYARFIPELLARAGRATWLASAPVAPLFVGLGAEVVVARGDVAIAPHDAWVLAGSLPLRLGVTLETLSGAPYLRAPQGRLAKWPGALRYGLVWRGSPTHANDANRSMTAQDAAPLLALPGIVGLQPEETKARDFADTAAIVDRLEAVITVDTAIAHLAGALGKRCLVMLPATHTDWRWLKARSDSPWYDSLTLYRQPTPGDWASVTKAVLADL